jgi:hypothetical protein
LNENEFPQKINDNGSSLVIRNNVEPKFKININNDELLEAIWEHIKQMKREGRGVECNLLILLFYFFTMFKS